MSTAVRSDGAAEPAAGPGAAARPWWLELGSVVPRSVTFAARAACPASDSGVPSLSVNPLAWATVAVDELAVSSAYLLSRRRVQASTAQRVAAAERAVERLSGLGALEDPGVLYPRPDVPGALRLTRRNRGGIAFEHLSFATAPSVVATLAELTEWSAPANDRAHAYLLRHGDRPRPWLVVVHGHRMGEPRDIRLLASRRLQHDLGVDVAHLVLPMHGPRGRPDGHAFPGMDPVANLLGVTQSVSDARALIGWIRAESEHPVGVFGISLGGLVGAMLCCFEPDLRAVVVGVPLADIATMLAGSVRSRWGEPAVAESQLLGPASTTLSRLASPLSFAPSVPRERRFVYAAIGDRLVSAAQAEALWLHWDRPAIQWLQGGHLLNNVGASRRFVTRSLAASGVAADAVQV